MSGPTRGLMPKENKIFDRFKGLTVNKLKNVPQGSKSRSLITIMNDRDAKSTLEIDALREALHNATSQLTILKASGEDSIKALEAKLLQADTDYKTSKKSNSSSRKNMIQLSQPSRNMNWHVVTSYPTTIRQNLVQAAESKEIESKILREELQGLQELPVRLNDMEVANKTLQQMVDTKTHEMKSLLKGYKVLEREVSKLTSERQALIKQCQVGQEKHQQSLARAEILHAISSHPRIKQGSNRAMEGKHLCTCVAYGCHKLTTPDGKQGYLLESLRTYRKHQKDDEKQQLFDIYDQAEARAKAKHMEELANTLDELSLSNPDESSLPGAVLPLTRPPRSNLERARQMISDTDEVHDVLVSLRRQAESIGKAPKYAERASIEKALGQLGDIDDSLAEQSRRLVTISYVKTPSVRAVHQITLQEWKEVDAIVRESIETWREFLEKQSAERRSQNIPVYNTDEHLQPLYANVKPLVQVVVLIVTACHVILRLPRRGTYWLFSMCSYLIQLVVNRALHPLG
ncbi:hypothetical protein FPV67DRAFT_1455884 [Lyophyllum atratum]|nr:hypothetical protein FPV67DRAFT_1455884 [Lyophyllum atratum]